MTLLAIDTSGPFCSAALISMSGEIRAERSQDIGRGHAERLMPMIEEILGEANLDWPAVKRIAVVRGPGSFTGLRVGLAVARGLDLARGVFAEGVTAFQAFASESGGDGAVALDARRGEIWFQRFVGGKVIGDPAVLSVDDCLQQLADGTRVVGSAVPMFLSMGAEIEGLNSAPSPSIIAVARASLSQPKPASADPLYLRAPDAKPQAVQPAAAAMRVQ